MSADAPLREGASVAGNPPGGRGWVRWVAPPALFALAFGVRCLPIHNVLVEGRTLFFGSDAYYHMRRIAYTIVHFPRSLDFDPYINHPHGGQPIWTPLFDWCAAALLRPFWRWAGSDGSERLAVFLPPLLGAATVVVLYFLTRRHFGATAAVLAGALLSVLSGHFWYSQIGFIDHHAAVALFATATLAATLRLLGTAAETQPSRRRGAAVATGVGIGASLALWPGCLLHVALIEVGLVVFALTRARRDDAIRFALDVALVHAVAWVIVAPFALGQRWEHWEAFSPVVLTAFQPWLLGLGAVLAGVCAGAWRIEAIGRRPASRAVGAIAAAAALLAVNAALWPQPFAALADSWQWFARADDFQHLVAESTPLFVQQGQFTWVPAVTRLSGFFLLLPIALVFAARRALRSPAGASQLMAIGWCLGLAVAACFQRRFFNSASVGVALLFALTLVRARDLLAVRFALRRRGVATAAVAFGGSLLLLPVFVSYAWHVENQLRSLTGASMLLLPSTYQRAATVEMAIWMRQATPPPSRWLDPTQRPVWGVMAPWTIGHVLEYEARRPTVTDNFGDDIGRENFLLARRYFLSAEPEAVAILERLAARFVVVQRAADFLGEAPEPASMLVSLFDADGSERHIERDGVPPQRLPGLSRHRLRFDARPLAGTDRDGEPTYKVFERVAGARLVGGAAPGARVRAELRVRSNRGRAFVYALSTRATEDGRYELVVPYATAGGPPGIRVEPHYRLACGDERAELAVAERAVRRGERVEGPSLCAASPAAAADSAKASGATPRPSA